MICEFIEKLFKKEHSMWLWALGVLVAFMLIALGISAFLDWLLT